MKDVLAINTSFMAASPFLANSRMTDQIKDNIFLLTHHEEGLDDDVDDPDDSANDDDQSSLDCLASDLTVTEGGGIGAGWAKNGLVMKMILSWAWSVDDKYHDDKGDKEVQLIAFDFMANLLKLVFTNNTL